MHDKLMGKSNLKVTWRDLSMISTTGSYEAQPADSDKHWGLRLVHFYLSWGNDIREPRERCGEDRPVQVTKTLEDVMGPLRAWHGTPFDFFQNAPLTHGSHRGQSLNIRPGEQCLDQCMGRRMRQYSHTQTAFAWIINYLRCKSASQEGFVCVGSTGFTVNDHFVCHISPPLLDLRFMIVDCRFYTSSQEFDIQVLVH